MQKDQTIAIAAFCKTPGYSAVKTRLAAQTGTVLAEEFYHLCISSVREVSERLTADDPRVFPYWAVAEEPAVRHELWRSFPAIWTGEGGLGERMHHVYDALLQKHGRVLLIGTDIPSLSPQILQKAAGMLIENSDEFVLGPCPDGGFYLFGGTRTVPHDVWTSVRYSREDTREQLMEKLRAFGARTACLPALRDADVAQELPAIREELLLLKQRTPAQQQLIQWMEKLAEDMRLS